MGCTCEISFTNAREYSCSVTTGAAYQLHADDEFGSVECGKAADFTVLEDSPLTIDPMGIKDIGVWGTIVGGQSNEAAHPGA